MRATKLVLMAILGLSLCAPPCVARAVWNTKAPDADVGYSTTSSRGRKANISPKAVVKPTSRRFASTPAKKTASATSAKAGSTNKKAEAETKNAKAKTGKTKTETTYDLRSTCENEKVADLENRMIERMVRNTGAASELLNEFGEPQRDVRMENPIFQGSLEYNDNRWPEGTPQEIITAYNTYARTESNAQYEEACRILADAYDDLVEAHEAEMAEAAEREAAEMAKNGKLEDPGAVLKGRLKGASFSELQGYFRGLELGMLEHGLQQAIYDRTNGGSHLENEHGEPQWDVRNEDLLSQATYPYIDDDWILTPDQILEYLHGSRMDNPDAADGGEFQKSLEERENGKWWLSPETSGKALEGVEDQDDFYEVMHITIQWQLGARPRLPVPDIEEELFYLMSN